MELPFSQRYPIIKDIFGIIIFILCVLVGTLLINTFVFRSFNVLGPSMEKTLYTNDRLIVNRLPVTWSQLQNKTYIPKRGEIIVFKNPLYIAGTPDMYIVKRVIAFPGERVTVSNGILTVYNSEHPEGFHPDDDNHGEPGSPTSGNVNTVVSDGTLFVAGDHREGDYSQDSRNGLGLVPFYDIIGPVGVRIYPFTALHIF
jgi:signal peptidase I